MDMKAMDITDSDLSLGECLEYLSGMDRSLNKCLNKSSRFLEAAVLYARAKYVYSFLKKTSIADFEILEEIWESLEKKKSDISKGCRTWLFSGYGKVTAIARALSAIQIIDNLNSVNLLSLFLESRKCFVSRILSDCCLKSVDQVTEVFCKIFEIIQLTLAYAGHLFMHEPSTCTSHIPFPLFSNTLLSSVKIGMPMPDECEEIRFIETFSIRLKGSLILIDQSFIGKMCSKWLWDDCKTLMLRPVKGLYLVDVMLNGSQLVTAENRIRETLLGKKLLRHSLGWLKTVYGSNSIQVPWKSTSQLFLEHDIDLWRHTLEFHFMERMEDILRSRFTDVAKSLALKDSLLRVRVSVALSSANYPKEIDSSEIGKIIDSLDIYCGSVLVDFLGFLESPYASLRLKVVGPFLQQVCHGALLTIIEELKAEMNLLYDGEMSIISVYQSLFIGRLVLAIGKISKQIPLILGSTELWVNKVAGDISGPGYLSDSSTSPQISGSDSPLLENFRRLTQDLSIKAHTIWISWISERASERLFSNLCEDETELLRVWDDAVAEEEHSAESSSKMKVSAPCMPSPYIISFLQTACEEVSRVGESLLDGIIIQNLASKLSGKVTETYEQFFHMDETLLSRNGVLQILLDLGFSADILSGGDSIGSKNGSGSLKVKTSYAGSQDNCHKKKAVGREGEDRLISVLVRRLDPVDWLTYEPYLLDIKRESYLHHAVNLKFFVQLNPMYTEYLGFGVATPFMKSLMQVGSGSSGSILKLGSVITDGQVGRSGAILHCQAAGLLSSITEGRLYV